MGTCERCGANAVDAQGRCAVCGFSASPVQQDSSPSLAETRAADLPVPVATRVMPPSQPGAGGGASGPLYAPSSRPATRAGTPAAPPVAVTARFCGACGARITGAEAFCGQCGTPLAASEVEYAGARGVVAPDPWAAGPDDLTEAYAPVSGVPASRGPLGAAPVTPAWQAEGVSRPGTTSRTPVRTGRVVAGVVCLAGSLVSGLAALLIALAR